MGVPRAHTNKPSQSGTNNQKDRRSHKENSNSTKQHRGLPRNPNQQQRNKQMATSSSAPHHRSNRTKDVDIHLASKISQEFGLSINMFKSKLNTFTFGKLDSLFRFVPPVFVQQHLPREVIAFRTYLTRFRKGSSNEVLAFSKWYEWASFEGSKGQSFHKKNNSAAMEEDAPAIEQPDGDEGDADDAVHGAVVGKKRKNSARQQALGTIAEERSHMRALLQMCLRHNSGKRKEGQHALVNHFKPLLADLPKCRTIEQLCSEAHHSVSYALSRLLLGMATDNFAHMMLNCQAIFLLLSETSLHPRVIISLIEVELNLDARRKALSRRMLERKRGEPQEEQTGGDGGDPQDEIDPDELLDPTKGERNQKLMAALFATLAVVASEQKLSKDDVTAIVQLLCYIYIEQKGTRVLSANVLMSLARRYEFELLLKDPTTWMWVSLAFFHFVKLEYFRPEAVQLLLHISSLRITVENCPDVLTELFQSDCLEPKMLEQIGNALFRREGVTAVHPMVHPVWEDILKIIEVRAATGESLKSHITNVVHTLISPFRRGNVEEPRRVLFSKFVDMLGHLALQNADEEERLAAVRITSKVAGFAKIHVPKPSDAATLRMLSLDAIGLKIQSLLRQYELISDEDPAAVTSRTWALKELRNCLLVPFAHGVETPYVSTCAVTLLHFGFFRSPRPSIDETNKNRAIYIFADLISFTYRAARASRPLSTVPLQDLVATYLNAEEKKNTRFSSCKSNKKFNKARNRLIEALESATRSPLFYDAEDIRILFFLLFLMISIDDQTNQFVVAAAATTIPDLVRFYYEGTIETLDIFVDLMMSLTLRPSTPLHVMPLMTFIRRICVAFLYRYAQYLSNRKSLEMVLSPLVDAFNTDDREIVRQVRNDKKKAQSKTEDQQGEDESEEGSLLDDDDDVPEEMVEGSENAEEDEEAAALDLVEQASDKTEKDEDDEGEEAEKNSNTSQSAEGEEDGDESAEETTAAEHPTEKEDDEDNWAGEGGMDGFQAEEPATQAYLETLKNLIGDVDVGCAYPTDSENKHKSDVVRAMTVATRVGLALRSPVVIHVYQVFLGVLRANVKEADPEIFTAAKSSIEMLLLSRNRYYGYFVPPRELLQLLGDIQSYCRKEERTLVSKKEGRAVAKEGALIRKRMGILKQLSLSVLHNIAFLAWKNNAGEDVRNVIKEYYVNIYCDRGWKQKIAFSQLKKDLYHYRHAFAWVVLDAAIEKFHRFKDVDGAKRAQILCGCFELIQAMLPRMKGLSGTLKSSAATSIRQFLSCLRLEDLFLMKQTILYNFFSCIRRVLKYNSRVNLDMSVVAVFVEEVVANDAILVSKATIRTISSIERMIGATPKIVATKAPVPVKVLYEQFIVRWRKSKSDFYRKAKGARTKTLLNLLAYRNNELTEEERAQKRRRREQLKVSDQLQRQFLREARRRDMTKEEKDEQRKKIMIAKQERIARNRERKRHLHERRKVNFSKWRDEKLAEDE